MQKVILTISILLIAIGLIAQEVDQKKSWINAYQEAIVSLGQISNTKTKNNQTVQYFDIIGSGMIFYVNVNNMTIPCLVTAKHILEDSSKNWYPEKVNLRLFRFQNEPLDKNLGVEITLKENGKKLWIEHDSKNVDLACLPLFDLEQKLGISDLVIFPYNLFASKDDYFEGAQLLVFGYPGIVEPNFQTRALVRYGVISWTSPMSPEENIILIDSDLYPGNSGGPVLKIPSTMDKYGNIKLGDQPRFLGIVSAKRATKMPLLDSRGNTILDPSGKPAFTWESVGIGVIESAHKVRNLLNKTQKLIESNKY